jgi:hypothetical protein
MLGSEIELYLKHYKPYFIGCFKFNDDIILKKGQIAIFNLSSSWPGTKEVKK